VKFRSFSFPVLSCYSRPPFASHTTPSPLRSSRPQHYLDPDRERNDPAMRALVRNWLWLRGMRAREEAGRRTGGSERVGEEVRTATTARLSSKQSPRISFSGSLRSPFHLRQERERTVPSEQSSRNRIPSQSLLRVLCYTVWYATHHRRRGRGSVGGAAV